MRTHAGATTWGTNQLTVDRRLLEAAGRARRPLSRPTRECWCGWHPRTLHLSVSLCWVLLSGSCCTWWGKLHIWVHINLWQQCASSTVAQCFQWGCNGGYGMACQALGSLFAQYIPKCGRGFTMLGTVSVGHVHTTRRCPAARPWRAWSCASCTRRRTRCWRRGAWGRSG